MVKIKNLMLVSVLVLSILISFHLVFADVELPQFSSFQFTIVNNSQYGPGNVYQFNVTITSINGTAGIEWAGVNKTLTNKSVSTFFNWTTTQLGAGSYLYYFWAYNQNGTDNNFNFTATKNYTVTKNSSLLLGSNVTESITYPAPTDFSGVGCPSELTCVLNITNGIFGVGTIYANYSTAGNTNYSANSTINSTVIGRGTPTLTYYINSQTTNISRTYPQQINASAYTTGGTIFIFRNYTAASKANVSAENGANVTLGVANYTYYFGVAQDANWNSVANRTVAINITQGTGAIAVYINGTRANYTENSTDSMNKWINTSLVTGEGSIELWVNGTLYNNGTSPLSNITNLTLGFYNITGYFTGNTNLTAANETFWINITNLAAATEETGSPGGAAPAWTSTFVLSDTQFVKGFTKDVATKERIKFTISNIEHYVGVSSLTSTTATIKIASTPVTATLSIGEEKKYEITNDSYYDLSVKLNNITSNKASLTLKSIHELITAPPEITPSPSPAPSPSPSPAPSPSPPTATTTSTLTWILVIVAVVVIIVVAFIIYRYNKNKKYYKKGY